MSVNINLEEIKRLVCMQEMRIFKGTAPAQKEIMQKATMQRINGHGQRTGRAHIMVMYRLQKYCNALLKGEMA